MQPVSGFMSFDGKFFPSAEECCLHEERVTRFSGLAERCKAVVEGFRDGQLTHGEGHTSPLVSADLIDHLRDIPEDDLIEIWNDSLMHLFVDSEGPIHEKLILSDWEFFAMTAETAYKVLAFVLGKTS